MSDLWPRPKEKQYCAGCHESRWFIHLPGQPEDERRCLICGKIVKIVAIRKLEQEGRNNGIE
jgi:hypothetical protein